MAKKPNGAAVNRLVAEFVMITNDAFKGAFPLFHDKKSRIWTLGGEDLLKVDDVLKVSDGTTDTDVDANGNYIISVPAEWCSFLTRSQAVSIAEALQKKEAEAQTA